MPAEHEVAGSIPARRTIHPNPSWDGAHSALERLVDDYLAHCRARGLSHILMPLQQRGCYFYLHIRGKGAVDRQVPVPRLYRRLRVYLERGRQRDTLSSRIFLAHRRRADGDYSPLTTSSVDQMIRNLAVSAGITKRVYPHLMRHSFATWQLTRGMNPIQLAQILGHSSLAMIQDVYAHLSPGDAYEAMLRTLRLDAD